MNIESIHVIKDDKNEVIGKIGLDSATENWFFMPSEKCLYYPELKFIMDSMEKFNTEKQGEDSLISNFKSDTNEF